MHCTCLHCTPPGRLAANLLPELGPAATVSPALPALHLLLHVSAAACLLPPLGLQACHCLLLHLPAGFCSLCLIFCCLLQALLHTDLGPGPACCYTHCHLDHFCLVYFKRSLQDLGFLHIILHHCTYLPAFWEVLGLGLHYLCTPTTRPCHLHCTSTYCTSAGEGLVAPAPLPAWACTSP